MIIGTLTYHRADNYGAVLQAYALCQYFREQGYNAENIDYWPRHHAVVYKLWCWNEKEFRSMRKIKKIKYLLCFPFVLQKNYKRKRNFDRFRKQTMEIVPLGRNYDAVFYGSDTIWNRWNLNNLFSGFDSVYWGNDRILSKHRFSYAPSMGNVIDGDDTKKHCDTYLPRFDKISVREAHLKKKLEEWGYKDIHLTVDPTMLLSIQSWEKITPKRIVKGDYILCYNLERSAICDAMAERIGQERKIQVIQMTATVSWSCKNNMFDTAGPFEFLSLFKYASYVVTSSFHGCVFSIIFNKLFCFHSNFETERITSLLNSLGIIERFVTTTNTEIVYKPIDYQKVNTIIKQKVTVSKEFISECITMAQKDNGKDLQ